MSVVTPLLRLQLVHRSRAPGSARRALTAFNRDVRVFSEARLADARLLLSELVANAVCHSEAALRPIHVDLDAGARLARVAVRDHGRGFDVEAIERTRVPDWRGLQTVGRLASAWGVDTWNGCQVWFEIDDPLEPVPLDITAAGVPPRRTISAMASRLDRQRHP